MIGLILTCAMILAVQAQGQPSVTSLIQGRMVSDGISNTFIASITMVQDGTDNILVDTPSATDNDTLTTMRSAIHQKGLSHMQLNKIVITHGHPDHFGQDGFFNMSATHYFNTFKYSGNSMFMPITYDKSTGAYQLTPNVQLWQTPGHTPQDISVIVNNVPSMGTVAIVGDLFLNSVDVMNSQTWQQSAWNVQVGMQNRNKVLCAANFIVPGHGPMFQVTAEIKNMACSRG